MGRALACQSALSKPARILDLIRNGTGSSGIREIPFLRSRDPGALRFLARFIAASIFLAASIEHRVCRFGLSSLHFRDIRGRGAQEVRGRG